MRAAFNGTYQGPSRPPKHTGTGGRPHETRPPHPGVRYGATGLMTHVPSAASLRPGMGSRARPVRWLTPFLIGAAILCAVAAVNRGPFYFYDTLGYLRTAGQALERVLGLPAVTPVQPERDAFNPAPATGEDANVKWGNRSVYFGLVLAVADRLNAISLVVVAQGLLAAWLLLLCWRLYGPRKAGTWGYLGLCAFLSILTPLGFYVAYLMPDLLFGLLLIALPLLLFEADRLAPWERAGLLLLVLFASLSHMAAVLFLGGLLVLGWILARFVAQVRPRRTLTAAILGAAILGIAGTWAVGKISERVFGQPALWPPFILARVTADGPGTLYLQDVCPREPERFVLCRYLADLPPENSDAFLWESTTHQGILFRASNAEQRRMIREQWDVVIPAVLAHPWLQLRASAWNAWRQLWLFGVEEFAWEDRLRRQTAALFPTQLDDLDRTRVANTTMAWWRPVNLVHGVVLLAAVALILARLLAGLLRPAQPEEARRETAWLLLLLAGVALNAVLSGVLAEPHSRYGARVIWVLPLAAALLLLRRHAMGRPGPGSP